MTAQDVADGCATAGYPHMTRGLLANIESGRRQDVTLDEAACLAHVLGVSLQQMLGSASTDLDGWLADDMGALYYTRVEWSDLPLPAGNPQQVVAELRRLGDVIARIERGE
jgi:transcriptional regulator with XRE-family HTH domain